MTKKSKCTDFVKSIGLTILGGLGLFTATALLNAFFSIPPTRAEFNVHKVEATRQLEYINAKLGTLTNGQDRILEHLLSKEGKK